MSKSSNRERKLSPVVLEESTAFQGQNGDGLAEASISAGPLSDGLDHDVPREAYELYRERGYVDGHDVGDWFEAERRVRQRREALGADGADRSTN